MDYKKCPDCGSKNLEMQILYQDVIARLPIRGGKPRFKELRYEGKRSRKVKCLDCGKEFALAEGEGPDPLRGGGSDVPSVSP